MCSRRRAATARPLGPAPMMRTSWIVGRVVVDVGVGSGWSMVEDDGVVGCLSLYFLVFSEVCSCKTNEGSM